jgi:cysteine sulfinate desulfinase/cysteine desulfurase-like protein
VVRRQRVELETLRKRQKEEREWYKQRKRMEALLLPAAMFGTHHQWSMHNGFSGFTRFVRSKHVLVDVISVRVCVSSASACTRASVAAKLQLRASARSC